MLLEDSYVEFLIEHDLTQGQYLLLHLIHKKRSDLIKKYKEKFPSDDGTMIGMYFIKDLVVKGFLIEDKINGFVLTKKFLEIFINKHTACDEIYDIYPTYTNLNGVNIPLTSMDRNVFANLYDKAIQSSILEHLEIVEDIKFGIEQNLLNLGLDKFVKSQYWLAIRKKRLEQDGNKVTKTQRDNEF
jgi:hypothetical protein